MPTPFHLVHILYISLMLCRNMIDVCLHKFCESKLHCIPILLFRFLTLRNSAYYTVLVPKSLTRFTTLWGLTWHKKWVGRRFTPIYCRICHMPRGALIPLLQFTWQVKGRFIVPFWMNFRKTSKRPLNPPPRALVSENYVALFREIWKSAKKFFW